MPNDLISVHVKAVVPTANGSAVFLGNDTKTFVIYVDHHVGSAIQGTLDGIKKERHPVLGWRNLLEVFRKERHLAGCRATPSHLSSKRSVQDHKVSD